MIITIVIMLILVGVGVNIAIDGNLIGTTQKAVNNYNNKVLTEQSKIDNLVEELDSKL